MADLIAALEGILGEGGVLAGEAAAERARTPWARLGTPLAIARPRTPEAVAATVKAARAAGVAVTPWGGLTGLVDGAFADGALALSLERMNAVETVDPATATMRVQAGCILQTACEAAETEGLLLPLDLGARGSATIGGNISTNAGGNRVLRFGMMRDMVLGLEAVLADGTIVSALNPLIKNNAGYDVKQLFIGSEGTLGIVTRAVLRLRPKPASDHVAFLAVDGFARLTPLLRRLERDLGGALSAFEVMWPEFYELVTTPPAKGRAPLPAGHPYYVLIEAMGGAPERDAERFEAALGDALEEGDIADAAIARSGPERKALWGLRDDVAQTARHGPIFTFDVSLEISEMEAYVAQVRADLSARWPAAYAYVFGHLGDGNLHLIIGVGDRSDEARLAVEEIVYRPLRAIPSSVSAEHGIGLQKCAFLSWSRSEAEIALMRALKKALDPDGLLNPGKVLA